MTPRDQHLHIAKLQRQWAAMAERDRKYNLKRAKEEKKAGNLILSRAYADEADRCEWWRAHRLKIAMKHEKMAKGGK